MANDLESVVRQELKRAEDLIEQGKGDWTDPYYVKDEIWSNWLDRIGTLRNCLRKAGLDYGRE